MSRLQRRAPADATSLRPIVVAIHFACLGLCAGAFVLPHVVHAEVAPAALVSVDLAAAPLAESLSRLALQAGVSLAVESEKLKGMTAPALKGSMALEEAFQRLLKGSGYAISKTAVGYVIVPAVASAKPVTTAPGFKALPEVLVTALPSSGSRYFGVSGSGAARLDADPMDLPIAGVSVPKALIDDQGVLRPADAVRNVSSVTRNPAYLGLTDTYRVRGFQSDIGLWNGFRRDFYSSFTDVTHIERIEVIKGPASVTYGDLEPGGVVNYVTKRPSRTPVNSVQFTTGSYSLVRPEFDYGVVAGDEGAVRLRFTGAHEQANSFKDYVENRHSTLGATLDWDVKPGTRLELSGYWLDSQNTADRGFFNAIGSIALQLPRNRFLGEPLDTYKFKQTDVSAMLVHRIDDAWQFRGGVNYYRVDDVRDNIQFRSMLTDRLMRRQYTYVPSTNEYRTVFSELRGNFTSAGLGHNLVAGVEQVEKDYWYDFRRDRSSDYAIDIFNPVYGQYTRTLAASDRYSTYSLSRSLYFQDLISIGERWKALAGLRYTRFSQEDRALDSNTQTEMSKSRVTPRLGLLYKLSQEHSVFLSYAQSFMPQIYSYAYLSPGYSPVPEQGVQWEAGYKYTALDESMVAGATLFQINKKNVAVTDPNDPNYMIIAGEQLVRGFEFDVNAKLGGGWSFIGSYAYLHSEITKDTDLPVGDRLVNTPRNQASAWMRHDLASLPGAGFGIGAFYVGAREAELPNTWTIPSYVRLDGSAYWKLDKRTDLSMHLKNLTDKNYFDSQGNLLYAGAPRSVVFSVRHRF